MRCPRIWMIALIQGAAFCLLLSATVMAGCQSAPDVSSSPAGWSRYGAAVTQSETAEPVSIGALRGGERDVVVTGTIIEVCAVKGCWMKVADEDEEVFVRFRDYGFFVPRNAAGHVVIMQGIAREEVTPVHLLQHYAEDAGATPDEVAAITEPKRQITFLADWVAIEGAGLDVPYRAIPPE